MTKIQFSVQHVPFFHLLVSISSWWRCNTNKRGRSELLSKLDRRIITSWYSTDGTETKNSSKNVLHSSDSVFVFFLQITMYHWDLPQKLQDMGGWTNSLIIDYILDFADLLFRLYGDKVYYFLHKNPNWIILTSSYFKFKVKWWITLNEPAEFVQGYERDTYAPALQLDSPTNYIVIHHALIAHGKIYKLYNEKYRSQQNGNGYWNFFAIGCNWVINFMWFTGKISISLSLRCLKEKTKSKEDIDARIRASVFDVSKKNSIIKKVLLLKNHFKFYKRVWFISETKSG